MENKTCDNCNNELIMEFSQALGICSHCREKTYPKYLGDKQWDKYWKLYLEKNE